MPRLGARLPILAAIALFASLSIATEIPVGRFYDDDPAVRQEALQQLTSMPPARKAAYIPQLTKLARSAESGANWLRAYRLEPVLARIGEAALPQLLPLLDDPAANVRNFAVAAVGMIRPINPATIERLRRMLRDEDPRVRVSAAEAVLSDSRTKMRGRRCCRQPARAANPREMKTLFFRGCGLWRRSRGLCRKNGFGDGSKIWPRTTAQHPVPPSAV